MYYSSANYSILPTTGKLDNRYSHQIYNNNTNSPTKTSQPSSPVRDKTTAKSLSKKCQEILSNEVSLEDEHFVSMSILYIDLY